MKTNPCDREAVTLLACSALDNAEADRTRRHLQQCAACRDYFRQLSEVCASHSNAARQLPTAEVSVRLRSRILTSLKPRSRPWWGELPAVLAARWLQLAGAAAFGLLLAAGLMQPRRPASPSPLAEQPGPPTPTPAATESAEPKLMAYRMALNRSPEEFDRLLTHKASRLGFDSTVPFRAGWARVDPGL